MHLEIARIGWAETGWRSALNEFAGKYQPQKNSWFFLQYTALAWSRRGFPTRFLSLLKRLKRDGARCAVVFHDVETYFGGRLIDRVRRAVQLHTMRQAARVADLSVLTIPAEKIPWLPASQRRTVFIPVGANLPEPERAWAKPAATANAAPGVAIFGVTGGTEGKEETRRIADAALFVTRQIGPLHLVVFGRNSETARAYFEERFRGTDITVMVHGLLPAEQIVSSLAACDAMLFVRGSISSRRGSAIAGIACGLPVVAMEGRETAAPITLAGVALTPPGKISEFGPTLLHVLSDSGYRASLVERSRQAQLHYFSWPAIAAQYLTALRQFEPKD